MPDGGEAEDAAVVAPPGHVMPADADPDTEEGLTAWVNSVHPKFGALGIAAQLIASGFDTVHSVGLVDAEDLVEEIGMLRGHAVQLEAASAAVRRALGYVAGGAVALPDMASVKEAKVTELALSGLTT